MSLRDRIHRVEIALLQAKGVSFRDAWRRHVESGGTRWPEDPENRAAVKDLRLTLFAMNRATGLEPGTHLSFSPSEEELAELAEDPGPSPTP